MRIGKLKALGSVAQGACHPRGRYIALPRRAAHLAGGFSMPVAASTRLVLARLTAEGAQRGATQSGLSGKWWAFVRGEAHSARYLDPAADWQSFLS